MERQRAVTRQRTMQLWTHSWHHFKSPPSMRFVRLLRQREGRFGDAGLSIGPLDTMIAAHALGLQVPLITNNEGEFSRVAGLQ